MIRTLLAIGVAVMTTLTTDFPAQAAASTTSDVLIAARALSACDQVMMLYAAPEGALIEIYRSVDGDPWERQLHEPNPRVETIGESVRYKIVVGAREAVTDSVVPHLCSTAAR